MSALARTSPTPDAWENLTCTVADTLQQTEDTYEDAKQVHGKWQKISLAAIENLQATKLQLLNAVSNAKTVREESEVIQNATLTALEQRINALAQTVTTLKQEIVGKEAHIAGLQATAQGVQQRIDYLLSPAGENEAAVKLTAMLKF